jgi:hypothetical protein
MIGPAENERVPATVVLDGRRLCEIRKRLHDGDLKLRLALDILVREADRWLREHPWTVTSKPQTPPSGDKHDYLSQAPYWWPADTPDGLPYVRRDGQVCPESTQCPDKKNKSKMFRSAYTLALAWFYTSNEDYAVQATRILRTWFIGPETKMNPNLNHAQIIPGANLGRAIGIIDFSQQYTSILDAVAILANSSAWTPDDMSEFRRWNSEFLGWLRHSPFGKEESLEKNNHGTFAALQKAGISLFLDDKAGTTEEVEILRMRMSEEIAADGSLPRELARTRSWHYSCFNLVAFTRGAMIARKVGIDLWSNQDIHRAVEFLLPFATGTTRWPHLEIGFLAFAAYDIARASADMGSKQARALMEKLEMPPEADRLWELRPAPEQLDAVKV